ncbi:hypothetical protein [Nocardia aurantia]|uniref:Uncharacterized protein n=1 Tax=Nocardia aurantia TaxID=2585199 RepID=A0A7K0DQS6_9NOCA|nr:hypothetical protein [Nocardia aurantia]MQY28125.1 hypothetical protein [Nocardia aurantia]
MPTEYPGTPPEVPDPRDAASGASGASPNRADEDTPTTRYRRGETSPTANPTDTASDSGSTAHFHRPGSHSDAIDAPTGRIDRAGNAEPRSAGSRADTTSSGDAESPGNAESSGSVGSSGGTEPHRGAAPGTSGSSAAEPPSDDADWWAHTPKIEYPSDTTGLVDAPVGPQPTLPLPGAPDVFPRVDPATLSAGPESDSPTAESGPAAAGPASPPRSMSGQSMRGAPPPRKARGSVQRQKAGVTTPRDPSLGEARAREKGRERAAAAEKLAAERLEAKRRNRKRVLIGGAAVAGVATLVGAGYLAYSAANKPNEVTAYCVTDDNNQQTVVPDDDCVKAQDYVTSYGGGGYYNGAYTPGIPGIFLYNGHQYRYYYGGSNTTIGSHPSGGSFSAPSHSVTSTKSGTVVRGGLGVKGGGKSGGS